MKGSLSDQSLIYLQIAQMLEDDILRGIYREDEQIPSTNELSRAYSINPATAAKGISRLVSDGVIYKRRGIGMFVSRGAAEMIKSKRRSEFTDTYILPLLREGRSLGISSAELLELIRNAAEKGEQ